MHIGIFDSGIGGKAIATVFQKSFPKATITRIDDKEHLPYGNKTKEEIITLTSAAVQPLVDMGCDLIVIACNTATTIALPYLRKTYPTATFVGIEPMVKQAAKITHSKNVAVCATPLTLQSERYNELKDDFASGINVIEPDCSDWAYLIENNQANKIKIKELVSELIKNNVDVIVLGCTHYNWIKDQIVEAAGPNIDVIEPSEAIVNRAKNLMLEAING